MIQVQDWHLNTVQVIIHYPNYLELIPDKEGIVKAIEETQLARQFPESEILPPPQVSGMVPVIDVRFFEANQRVIPFIQVLIEPTSMRFTILGLNQSPREFLERDVLSDYLKLIVDFWKQFDEVASRKVIQRLGLVVEFSNEKKEVLDYLRKKLIKSPIHDVFEIRFSKFLKGRDIEPFKNTTVVPNLFISPTVAPVDPKDFSTVDVRQVRVISDLATTPSSKGIIDTENLEDGLLKLLYLSKEQLKQFWRIVSE